MSKYDVGALLRIAQDAVKHQPGHRSNMKLNHAIKVKGIEKSYQENDKPWTSGPSISILRLSVLILIYIQYENDGVLDKKEIKELKKVIKTLGLPKDDANELMVFTEKRLLIHELDAYIDRHDYQPGSVVYAANIIKDLELKTASNKLINAIINDYNEKRNV